MWNVLVCPAHSVFYFMLWCPISSTADQATMSKSKRSTASIIIFPTVVFKGWHSYFLQIVAGRSWCCELPKLSLFIRCNKNVYLIVFTKIEMGGLVCRISHCLRIRCFEEEISFILSEKVLKAKGCKGVCNSLCDSECSFTEEEK